MNFKEELNLREKRRNKVKTHNSARNRVRPIILPPISTNNNLSFNIPHSHSHALELEYSGSFTNLQESTRQEISESQTQAQPKPEISESQTYLEPPPEPKKKKPYCTLCRIITVTTIILIVIILAIFWKKFTKKAIMFNINLVKSISELKEPFSSGLYFTILFTLDLLFIPGQTTLGILITISKEQFLIPCLILILSSTASAWITYLMAKKCCRKKIIKKYKDTALFKLVMTKAKKSPFKVNLMVRMLYIPIGFKNYLLPVSESGFCVYACCQFPFAVFFAVIITFVGMQLDDPMQLLDTRNFNEKTGGEKFQTIVGFCFIIVTVVLIVGMCIWSRKKLKQIEQEHRKVNFFFNFFFEKFFLLIKN